MPTTRVPPPDVAYKRPRDFGSRRHANPLLNELFKARVTIKDLTRPDIEIQEAVIATSLLYKQGMDVSQWQGSVNFGVASDAGVEVAYIRAMHINSNGTYYVDVDFEENDAGANQDLGDYGFYVLWRPVGDQIALADAFCNLIAEKGWTRPPCIDVEISEGKTSATIRSLLKIFADRVEANLGVIPAIYTAAWFWNTYVVPSSVTPPVWIGRLLLWVARWSSALTGPWSDGWGTINGWPTDEDAWWMWQYEADGNGKGAQYGAESDDIDLDYLNEPPGPVDPPPPPDNETALVRVLFQGNVNVIVEEVPEGDPFP